MIGIEKTVRRKSGVSRREAGKTREIIVSLLPTGEIGFRLEGTRDTYTLPVEAGYEIAVKSYVHAVSKRAKQIRATGVPSRSARKRAADEFKESLRGLS